MSDKEKPRRRAPGQPWYQASFDAPDNNLYFVLAFLAVVVSLAFYADYGLRTHLGSAPNTGEIKSRFFDYSVTSITGEEWNLGELKGKIVLAVNVASKCGFTNQYPGLENLYQTYKNRGLVVIGFPCNQFGGQEPAEEEEILTFCQSTYDVSFPLTQKIDVNGKNEHPIYTFLKTSKPGVLGIQRIKWNFEKFLIDRQGKVFKRYASAVEPKAIKKDIENLL